MTRSCTQKYTFWFNIRPLSLPFFFFQSIKMGDEAPRKQEEEKEEQYYDQMQQYQMLLQNDSHSVILVTAGYDNTIRFWEALSGICSKTIKHPDSVTSWNNLYTIN